MKRNQDSRGVIFLAALFQVLAILGLSGCNQNQATLSPDAKAQIAAEDLLKSGNFIGADQVLASSSSYLHSLSELALGKKPDFQRLSLLIPEKREYVLSLLALFEPQAALDYLHTRPALDPEEAQIALTALKIQNQSRATILKQEESWLYPASAYEKSVQSTVPPSSKLPTMQFQDEVKTLVAKTQKLRGELGVEIAGKPPEIQLRIMEADRALENRVGLFIRSVSPPHKISGQRLVNYKKGLARIAEEFIDRAIEISKLETPIRENPTLQRPKMERWPWPPGFSTGSGGFAVLNKAVSEKNYVGALILADLLRPVLLKNDEDYYSVRTGVLLMYSRNDAPMSRYALEELTKAKQDALILKWKNLGQ